MPGQPNRSGGKNRVSVAQHRLKGTFRRDRHAERAASAFLSVADVSDGPPGHLDPASVACWTEMAPRYQADSDLGQLELAATITAQYRRANADLVAIQQRADGGELVSGSALLKTLQRQAGLLRSILAGLRPVERVRPTADEFSEFDAHQALRYGGN